MKNLSIKITLHHLYKDGLYYEYNINCAFSHPRPCVFQVSVAIAWAPDCIDIRCYDYLRLIQIADLAIVMAYDERSQIFGECVAWANSPVNQTSTGC